MMMTEISINKLQTDLLPLSKQTSVLCQRLMAEQGHVRESLGKLHSYFSDQEVGQAVIAELSQAMRELQCAYYELDQLKKSIVEFTCALSN
jgi:hypothetical protein